MAADKMQPVITNPLGDRRARRQAHHDAEADQHAERGKAPAVDGPPPPRNRALIDPRESHWRRLPLTLPLARAPPSPRSRGEGLSAQLPRPACGERVRVRGLSRAEIGSMPIAASR